MEVIKQRGHYEKKILDLKNTIRNLEVDKNYLDDHCFELVSKISEMEHRGKSSKGDDGKVKHKKAFVSTVPSGIPPYPNSATSRYQSSRRCDGKSSSNDHHIQMVILQNENQLLKDEINSLKKQVRQFGYCLYCHFQFNCNSNSSNVFSAHLSTMMSIWDVMSGKGASGFRFHNLFVDAKSIWLPINPEK